MRERPTPEAFGRDPRYQVRPGVSPEVCQRCGFPVVCRPFGCKNPCSNCGTVYPLGDCSD